MEKWSDSFKIPDEAFEHEKKLIEMKKEADELKHKMKMEELQYERESARIFHDMALERKRIERAEERKMMNERRFFYKEK